ncbi:AAA domain-containing protein [Cladophialophora immunda]|nr:AAA domain-containing protein [Cladophialophora immunda]
MRPYISASTAGRGLICDTVNILSPDPRPRLSFTDDGPGKLSVFGPRHDNDNENYRKIKILPTADEILAVHRPTYMPKKDLSEEHFLDNGPGRLLDTLFRQLRYDSTENIRDICYSASQIAFLGSGTDPGGHVRQETGAGNRYFLYNNVKIEELLSHEQMAMVVRVSYDCPPFMRAQKLYDSGRFQKGMLVALLQLNHATMKLSVYFLEVHLAQSTFSMECFDGRGTRAAVQLSFLPTTTHDDVLQLCRHALGLCEGNELYLVEFPKVLFAGFYNCLKRLQQMAETDFAFQSYVAPDKDVNGALLARNLNSVAGLHSQFPCPPPSYALSSDFAYNLTKLVPLTCPIASASVRDLSRPSALDMLSRETTLDEGQAVAFRDSLLREYACTQGPPGCGKTFLGVQLTKTLLDSRPTQKPILLVCLTNHALDSFLADLRDAGVSNLLRVGSASKEDWTDAINLRSLRRKTRMKKENAQMLHANGLQKKLLFAELDSLCKALSSQTHSGTPPWHYVEGILRNKYPDVHSQFMTNPRVSLAQSFTFEYWSGGGDLKTIRDLHLELACRLAQTSNDGARPTQENVDEILLDISYRAELQSANAGESSIWNLPLRERQSMLRRWEAEVDKEKFADKMASLYSESRVYTDKIKTINDGRDVQIMSSQNIIAMTTTACAARWELLRSVDPEILICEEAAEVMEAHALCTLLPSLKHAIFIGDPQQLRPETNEQSLSLETSVGRQYRLDESLLERLMFPHDMSASVIPSSHLSVQRRMHPDIANITRLTYPYLTDHESTLQRSPTHGIAHRVFWWDHRVPELESDDLKSHANLHEVEMVASLVEYLLRSGAYSQGEVAVLTPYAGQLLKLYERLATTCDIWLSEKDREALLGEEILGLGDEGRTSKDEVAISDMLRIATVDNFQGEEAKVIILSTVRSGGTAGFLKTLNRINVACSRARNGFYIVGNSQTLSQVPRWREVINALKIAQLDARNLHGIYKVDDDGVILSINSGVKSQDIAPPKCLCGESLHGIRRYRLHSKLVAFKNTFDLLLAKMGRKLAAFATVIEVQEKQLDRTFKACVEEIRPNPLAAKSNASLVLRRNQEILDLQKNIINFRSEVVDRIQSSITVLHKVFPNVIPSYDLSFHLHLDVLECRVVGVRLADALKLANQLLPLQDPSFGVQRLGLKMIQFAYKESISCANYCQGALGHSLIGRNSSLEAEIRLQQLQFMLFAKTTRAQLSELGHPVDDNVMLMNGETVKVGLEAVNAIGRRSPGTCTGLMATAQDIAIAFEHQVGSKLPPIPKIKNDYTRQVENLWGRHQLGYLVMCCRSHPYSAKTFSDGCPYCEKQAQLSVDEIFRESGKHLFEEQFLQIMHSRAPMSHKSDHHDPERAKSPVPSVEQETSKETATSAPVIELTAEERFLAAMRRGPPKIHAGVPSEAMKEQSKAAVEAEVAREVDIGAGVEMKVEVRMDMQESIAVEPEKELTMEEKFLVAMRRLAK